MESGGTTSPRSEMRPDLERLLNASYRTVVCRDLRTDACRDAEGREFRIACRIPRSKQNPGPTMPIDFSRLILIERLIDPIQQLIRKLLSDFAEENLQKPEVRETIVAAVDTALVTNYPVAGAIPASLRRRIIRKQPDMIIDDIVLRA